MPSKLFFTAVVQVFIFSASMQVFALNENERPTEQSVVLNSAVSDSDRAIGFASESFTKNVETLSPTDKSILVAQNIGLMVGLCPISHFVQSTIAVGESVPFASMLTNVLRYIGQELAYAPGDKKPELGKFMYLEGQRTISAYALGGPLNALANSVGQIVGASILGAQVFDAQSIKQAFIDGYYSTREAQAWNYPCYRAERRLQILFEKK